MSIVYRIASSAGQHLRKRLQAMAIGLVIGSRRGVFDGHILQVQALGGGTVLAQALDVPGYLLLLGYQYRTEGSQILESSPVLQAPVRDTLLSASYFENGGRLEPLPPARTFIYQVTQSLLAGAGPAQASVVAPFSAADFVPGVGVLYASMRCNVPYTLAPWTKVTASMPCDAEVMLVNPLVSRVTFNLDGTRDAKGSQQSRLGARRIVIGEAFLQRFDSSALSVTRQSGVPNEAYWEDLTYSTANIPRVRCSAGPQGSDENGPYLEVVLGWSFVTDQQGIWDRFAQHNLGFVRLRVYATQVQIRNSAALMARDFGTYAPSLDDSEPARSHYRSNRILVNAMTVFNDGTVIAISRTARNGPPDPGSDSNADTTFQGSILTRFGADGGLSRQWIMEPRNTTEADIYALYDLFSYPIGLDTNGEDYGIAAVASVGGLMAQRGDRFYEPAVMAIYAFDKSGHPSQVTTAQGIFMATGQDLTTGSGERLVRHIGGDRFAIIAARAVIVPLPGNPALVEWARDLRCFIFDRKTGQLTEAGQIDNQYIPNHVRETANGYAYGANALGNLDVLVKQLTDSTGKVTRHAVLVMTRGGIGYRASVDGVVAEDTAFPGTSGTTWISHDSGATWNVMADYGSGLGLYYTGNQISTRPFMGTTFS